MRTLQLTHHFEVRTPLGGPLLSATPAASPPLWADPHRDRADLPLWSPRHRQERLCRLAGRATDRPLRRTRASDLLNPFVGGTKANIAALFREATRCGAVLLLDEADSFLQDRQGAHVSWEVTQVNELLVQMETFEGIFLCATNLMDRLDPAVLRRFDLKVELGYLQPAQAAALFRQVLAEAGGPATPPPAELGRLTNLTPGDFATVVRKARGLGMAITAAWLLTALAEESQAKPGAERRIGFVG